MQNKLIRIALTVLFTLGVLSVFGQVSEYSFTQTAATYTELTAPTVLHDINIDDAQSPVTEIGFPFIYDGVSYTQFKASSNGFVTLNTASTTNQVNALATQSLILGGFWDDLKTDAAESSVSYLLTGTAPNRILKVQYKNLKWYYNVTPVNLINFQIWLSEGTNSVKYVYGTMGTAPGTSATASIGMSGATAGQFISITPAAPTATYSTTTEFTAINATHVPFLTGMMFTFAPPVANQPPNPANLVTPANNATLVALATNLTWSSGGGLPTGYRLYFGTNNPPTNLVNGTDMGAVVVYDPPTDLLPTTTYYWKVVPYNAIGNATNCPVWQFTTHGDPTITTLPYNQNFDAVTAPAFPFDWTTIYESTTTAGYVKTVTTTPQSTPNCVAFSNSSDAAAVAMLVGPPLATTIAPNTVRVKFYAKGGVGYPLSVGMMTNGSSSATYTEVQSVSLTAAWTQYVVTFAGYTGAGRIVAFKHGNGGTYRTMYVDNVEIELISQNDLAVTALTGNTTPSVNTATTYTASVFNWGSVAQSNYTVKLYNANNVQLATAAGLTVAPGATAQVPISWTPTAEGPVTIYAKVILTGDQNATNDQSPNLSISVMPAGTFVVTVGTGDLQEGVPMEFFYKNGLFETLYYPNEIGMFGNITTLSFYNNFITDLQAKPTKLWLGTTTEADLSAGWILPAQLTLVYDGTVNYPSGQNTITIPLQTPFTYSGGNLVLYANRPMDTAYFSSSDNFAAQTVGTTRARKLVSDTTEYDPNAPSAAGTLSGTFPKTTFHMTPLGPNPIFVVSPANKDFGTVLMNSTSNQTFTVMNGGGGTLTVSNVTIAGSPFFTLQNVPTLPVNLATGQTMTFVGRYLPTAAGTHAGTISITDNTTRVVHTVALTGTCIDVTINTLPYTQAFDTVTAPALPLDWNFIYQGTVTTGYVRTVTTTPNSAPNCVALYNSTDANANTILIAPPLGNSITPNTTRVKFYAKATVGYTLSVGMMTNYQDAATFTQVQSIDLTATWTQYVVSFAGYTGAGRYIAFKHGNGGASRTIYVDNAEIEVIPQNDLAVTALSGNVTPSMGSPVTYTASVYNWGSVAQSNYSVKLYNANNVQLATAAGLTVAPGATVQVPISWTPTAEGIVTIYAKVVLTGDQNPTNDQSYNLNISVMAAGMIVVTVGAGDQVARMPMDMYYKNSLFETLYYPTEMGLFGNITALSFYNNFVTDLPNKPTKIWLGTTTQADLSAGWVPSTQMTLVFDGNVNYPTGQNTITIPLQTAFAYTGGNLVMMVNRPMDTAYFSSSDNFLAQTVGTNRSLKLQSDTTTYDPAAPTTGTLSGQFPKTTFHMTAIGTNPIYSVNPASKDYGTVLLNSTSNQTFTVMNGGGGTLTISNIAIAGSPFFTLQNMPTLPVNLATGQTMTFVGRYNPTAAGGPHTATITLTDNMTRNGGRESKSRLVHTIALTGNCIDTTINTLPYTQLFDAVTAPALPPDWSFLYQGTVTTGYVKTVTTTPQSAPNCVALYNSTDANANVMLIAPPLGNSIAPNTTRVKFYAKGTAGHTLSIGMMTNYLDAATFAQVQSIDLTTTWTQYVVTFAGYTGAGRYITFKHGLGGTSRTMYVDNVEIELTPQNDLAAISLTGNQTPSNGMASNYTVSVFNWGTNTQNAYTVKLFKQGDVEIGSVPGTNVAPGATVQVTIPWTPTAEGANTLYGKVVLTGDQNATNDQTPNLAVVVQPAGLMLLTVGAGDQTGRVPVDMYYKNSLFETLYFPAEIDNTIGTIFGISFYNSFITNLPAKPTKVWMGTTTSTDLSAGWIPSTQLTLVYDGTIDYPSGTNTIYVPFQTPYLYLNSQNLVLMVQRPMDTAYFSSSDNFLTQTIGTNRSIAVYSDTTPFDPAAPPVPTTTQISGRFPKTTFHIIPGGVGHLNGTILGVGNQPLSGVAIQFATGGYATTTDAQGHYGIQNIIHETYQVSFSHHGYITNNQTVVIPEDETVVLNLTMQQMPVVNVTGTILASDTGAGLAGVGLHLTGYDNYAVTTNAAGQFTIPAVYANNTYSYVMTCPGYQNASGEITVGATNYAMGNVTLSEVAYAPRHVNAAINSTNTSVNLTWEAPDPTALDLTDSFEAATFPPENWTRTVTNTGAINTAGVYPTWCSFGNVTIDGNPANPTDGQKQAGLWWSYDHQDEWLITPQFNCPPSAYLTFDTWATLGSTSGDHYYVKVSSNDGATWTVLWDASAQAAGTNHYSAPITVDLSLYEGLAIKIAWHAVDPPTNDGLWSVWFIDNVYIGNEVTSLQFPTSSLTTRSAALNTRDFTAPIVTTNASRAVELGRARAPKSTPTLTNNRAIAPNPRSLTGYKVWRLQAGQETTEAAWTLVTTAPVVGTATDDAGWSTLPNGTYRWAVKAVYTGNVLSVPTFSLPIVHEVINGSIAGVCRNPQNQPVIGVTITAGTYTATTNNSGAYNLSLPVGTYTVRAAKNGYLSVVNQNVIVNANGVTTLNFTMVPGVGNDDQVVPIVATELNGNYPNPFNPETTISYAIKDRANVRLEIFNTKGQLVRTLVNQEQATGRYSIVWNGRDNDNNSVSSGMYFYRMNAGSYVSTRKMLLMQ